MFKGFVLNSLLYTGGFKIREKSLLFQVKKSDTFNMFLMWRCIDALIGTIYPELQIGNPQKLDLMDWQRPEMKYNALIYYGFKKAYQCKRNFFITMF